MAAFNPELQDKQNNFLGMSRGAEPNRSFETLFEGAGAAIAGAAKVVDEHHQGNIRKDITAAYDEANDMFGVTSGATLGDAAVSPTRQAVPQEVNDAQVNLKRMKSAMEQGKLKPSHYSGRLEAEVVRLRAKYPGYREQIDSIVSDVTGINPANALRQSLISEMEAENESLDATAKEQRSFINANIGKINETLLERYNAGDTSVFKDIHLDVAQKSRKEEEINVERLELSRKADKRTHSLEETTLKLAKHTNDYINNIFDASSTQYGANYQEFQANIDKMKSPDSAGGATLTADEQGIIRQQLGLLKSTAMSGLNHMMSQELEAGSGNSFNSMIPDKSKREEASIAILNQRFAAMEDYLLNEQTGLLAADKAYVEATKTSTVSTLLREQPMFKVMQAVSSLGMGDALNARFLESTKLGSAFDTSILNIVEGMHVSTNQSVDASTKRMAQEGVKDPEVYKKLIKDLPSILMDPNSTAESIDLQVQNLFGVENNGFLSNFRQEDKVRIFQNLVNPEVTMRMQELSETNPQYWENYKRWATDNLQTIFRDQAAELQENLTRTGPDGAAIKFNEKSMQFELDMESVTDTQRKDPFGQTLGSAGVAPIGDQITADVKALNSYIRTITPIFMAEEDSDPTLEIAKIMQGLGVKFMFDEDGPEDNMSGTPESKDGDISGIQLNDEMLTQYANTGDETELMNMIGTAEGADYNTVYGGGTEPLTTMTVAQVRELQRTKANTPMGKFQIIDTTLDSLINDGTLDDDELFDEDTQNRAALALLNRRGLKRFKAGKMSKADFLKNLSQEWASIPTTAGGLSYYQSDGTNKATRGGQAIASMFSD